MKKLSKEKKRKYRQYAILTGGISAAVVFIISIVIGVSHFLKPVDTQPVSGQAVPVYELASVEKPAVEKAFLTKNVNSRPGTPLEQVRGAVVHYTANPGTDAMANRNYFESRKDCKDTSENKVSSHYIIGLDGAIVQCIPEKEIAYASNERNEDTISIECCHPNKSGKFSDATYKALIHLLAYLCVKYEFGTDSIIRHYDVTGKPCPKYYVKHETAWEGIKQDTYDYLIESRKEEQGED